MANLEDLDHPNELGITDLHRAVYDGNKDTCRDLIHRGHQPDIADVDGLQPLHYACYLGRDTIVEYLISLDYNNDLVNAKCNAGGYTPLWYACVKNRYQCVDHLLKAQADCASSNAQGQPLIVILSWDGSKDIIEALCKHGANLEAVDSFGFHSLHSAARGGNGRVLRYLLGRVNDPDVLDNKCMTPLAYAAKEGKLSCVLHLLQFRADCEVANNDGSLPLHHASLNNHAEIVKVLLSNETGSSADVNASDKEGCRALHLACASGSYDAAAILIENKADKNALDRECRTPLWYACNGGHFRCVELLMECKADAKIFCRSGFHPIHRATLQGETEILKHMVKKGVEINVCANEKTTLDMAKESGNEDTISFTEKQTVVESVSRCNDPSSPDTQQSLPGANLLESPLLEKGVSLKTLLTLFSMEVAEIRILIYCVTYLFVIINRVFQIPRPKVHSSPQHKEDSIRKVAFHFTYLYLHTL